MQNKDSAEIGDGFTGNGPRILFVEGKNKLILYMIFNTREETQRSYI